MHCYTERALSVCALETPADGYPCPAGSRGDFLQALRILSLQPPDNSRFQVGTIEVEAVQVAFLRCPYEVWLDVFGEPESVREHHESLPLFPVHVWVYRCSDGLLKCVGYQVQNLHEEHWVTFVRLCYF